MRVAVIGLGMVSEMHLAALQELSGAVDLVGVHARSEAHRREVAARFGVTAYESVSAIADDPQVDAAIVVTPPNARLEIVRVLAGAGKHILMEKPVERTLAAAREIVDICDRAGVTLGIVFQHRFREGAEALGRLVEAGVLGEIALVRATIPWWRDQSYYDAPGRGTYEQDGGGVGITQAIHVLDLMLSLTGPVARVQAMQATTCLHRMEAEDFTVSGVQFASGAVGSIVATTSAFPGGVESLSIDGTLGSAELASGHLTVRFRDGRTEEVGAVTGTGGGADPMAFPSGWHRDLIAEFAQSVLQGNSPRITGQDALAVHGLIDAMAASSRAGAVIELGPITQQSPRSTT